jgi:hypothetical protein
MPLPSNIKASSGLHTIGLSTQYVHTYAVFYFCRFAPIRWPRGLINYVKVCSFARLAIALLKTERDKVVFSLMYVHTCREGRNSSFQNVCIERISVSETPNSMVEPFCSHVKLGKCQNCVLPKVVLYL